MGLLDILAAYRKVRDAIAAGEYLNAWQVLLTVQQGMIDLGRSLGFKGTAEESTAQAEIVTCAGECCELIKTASVATEAVGAFDWRALLVKVLEALFEAWKPKT